jgi:serine/threonine protein kinase
MDINRVALFLDQLRQAQVLDPAQFEQAQRHPLARGEDPVPLAKDLVQRGWLTLYQAKELLQQRAADLVFGPYRILDLLGEGGMGRVFRASHQTMGRTVALKVIKAEHLDSPTAVQRFHQEIRAAAQLTHPNIVTAFDAGQAGSAHFFAMEFVEGVDLGRLVKQSGPLSVAASCDYIRQAALGLQHAHERGLVHRDIKPPNLLLSRTAGANGLGTIKLLDLGLARMQADQPSNGLTRLGTVVGTPEFLAPEQAVNSRTVDIRADLYSLGCTFYYLLTGQPPFRGNSLNDLLLKHAMEAPPPLETFRSDVPPVIQGIVRKLLAKRPDERFQTPAELVAALPVVRKKGDAAYSPVPTAQVVAPVLDDKPSPLSLGAVQRPSAARNGRKRLVVIAASVAVLVLVGLVLALAPLAARDQGPAVAQASRPAATGIATFPIRTRPETRPQDTQPLPSSSEKTNPTGTWKWTTSFGGQSRETTIKLKLDGDRLTGAMLGLGPEGREMPLEDPKYKDGMVSFKVTRERKGQKFAVTYEGVVNGDTIKGKMEFDNQAGRARDWEAKRVKE